MHKLIQLKYISALALLLSVTAHAATKKDIPLEIAAIPSPNTLYSNVLFVAFDTETTGFSPSKERLVELGAVKFKGDKIIEEKTWLINPGRPIPWHATQVHHISNEMVADKPSFKEIADEFVDFSSGAVLLAHNSAFDVNFLREEYKRNGKKGPINPVIDTLALSRKRFPDCERHNLETLVHYLNLDSGNYHRATDDARYLVGIMGAVNSQAGGHLPLSTFYKDGHPVRYIRDPAK